MSNQIPKNLCNDLNRLAAVNVISFLINKPQNIIDWKDSFLRDIGVLMVYHQLLSRFNGKLATSLNAEMTGDLIKTGCLLLLPQLSNLSNLDWMAVGVTMGGVVIYHTLVRPKLLQEMKRRNIGFNEGIEDLVETVLLLALSRNGDLSSILSQLFAIAVAHAYLWH